MCVALAALVAACSGAEEPHNEPASTSGSLREQQAELGWGRDRCPPLPADVSSGYLLGDQLDTLVLRDCDGHPVDTREICGADVLWLSIAHAWCPHCRQNAANMEATHADYRARERNLGAMNILIEGNELGSPATEELCASWRVQFGQDRVLTLFDPDDVTQPLFEQSFTALNVFIDRNRIIARKLHTDVEADIRNALDDTLPD